MRYLFCLVVSLWLCGSAFANGPIVVGEATLSFTANTEPSTGPRWKIITVENIFGFGKKGSNVGSAISVLVPKLPSVTVEITKTKLEREGMAPWTSVETKPIEHPDYLVFATENKYVSACFVHPAQKARLRSDVIRAEELPSGVKPNLVKCWIQLPDAKSDALITTYCCKDNSTPMDQCDYTCSDTYLKQKGRWKKVTSSKPA